MDSIQELRLPANFFPQPLAFVQLCEGMIPNINAIDETKLSFEKKNCLILNRPNNLILLEHHTKN